MKIIFNDKDDVYLGELEYLQVSEMLIPAFSPKHDSFIKQKFNSNPNISTWQLISIQQVNNQTVIKLDPVLVPKSVASFAAPQHQKINNLVTEFAIVEVDFGFYSNIIDSHGNGRKNDCHTNTLMTGEMHKKRPCILLKKNQFTAQVIPLTSEPKRTNYHLDVKVDLTGISALHPRYKIDSYALIEMIQTVSYDRVFPPKANDGKYKHSYFDYRISKVDREAIKTALASQYNAGVLATIRDLEKKIKEFEKDKTDDFKRNIDNIKNIKAKDIRIADLESLILKVGNYFDFGNDINVIESRLAKEL